MLNIVKCHQVIMQNSYLALLGTVTVGARWSNCAVHSAVTAGHCICTASCKQAKKNKVQVFQGMCSGKNAQLSRVMLLFQASYDLICDF